MLVAAVLFVACLYIHPNPNRNPNIKSKSTPNPNTNPTAMLMQAKTVDDLYEQLAAEKQRCAEARGLVADAQDELVKPHIHSSCINKSNLLQLAVLYEIHKNTYFNCNLKQIKYSSARLFIRNPSDKTQFHGFLQGAREQQVKELEHTLTEVQRVATAIEEDVRKP